MRTTTVLSMFICLCLTAAPILGQDNSENQSSGELMAQVDPMATPSTSPPPPASNPVVLRVNGNPIHAVEISMVMQVDQRELAQVATQRVIEQKLLVEEAGRFGVQPDELQVARAAQMAEQQSGGRAMLEAKLNATGSTYEQFLSVIREVEIMKTFVGQHVQPNITVEEKDIAAYYEANPTLFDAEERVHAYHMIFLVGEDSEPAALTAARDKAVAARQRVIDGGEDFITVARELSEGPSAPAGGDLGWVNRGQLVSPLSETVFGLEPGGISEVIQTRFGFHVASISERRPAERIGLEDASPQIEDFLKREKATEAVGKLLERLLQTAEIENLIGGGPASSVGPGN